MAIVTRTALKLCIALATAISVTAACQNCQEFQFNSVDDAAALSQLQEFLSQHSEYGSTISIDTTIGIEKASAVLKKATNDQWRGWKNAGDRYYKCFTDLKMTYLEAKSHCNIFKGRLAVEVLRNPDIVSNIASICVTQGHHPWIGLDDIQNEGLMAPTDFFTLRIGDIPYSQKLGPVTSDRLEIPPGRMESSTALNHKVKWRQARLGMCYSCTDLSGRGRKTLVRTKKAARVTSNFRERQNNRGYYQELSTTTACDSDNCQEFHFNGVDDDEAMSQLQKFLSTKVGDNDVISIMTNIQMEDATLEGALSTTIEYGDDVTSVTSIQTEHATLEGASSTTMEYGNGAISATTIQMDQTITEITKTEAATTNSLLVGWEKAGRTYYKCFNDRKMTYVQAKANCTGYNGRLAAETLRDPVAARNISSHCLKSASTECLWIGYDDIIKEGQWIWSDGGATTNATTQWADNQPDNYTGTEDCGCIVQRFHKGLFINDNPCEAELNFVCEVPRK